MAIPTSAGASSSPFASVGNHDEARKVLEHVRGEYDAKVKREFWEIKDVVENSTPSSPLRFLKILGAGGKASENLGQRAGLCLFLQIIASWTRITAVTAYSPVLSEARCPELTQNGLAGGLNTAGIVGTTIICAQIMDPFGRRRSLMGGSLALFAVKLIAGEVYEAARTQPEKES